MLMTKVSRYPACLLLAVVLLLRVDHSQVQGRLQRCQRPPPFQVNGIQPMALTEGRVTMVALLTSTCPYCIAQARRMHDMSIEEEHADVHMMIVNGGPRPGPGEQGIFEGIASFPVYHDDNRNTIWRRVFRGNKDDIFIFNRCGQLTYRIPFPYCHLEYSYVRRALRRTKTRTVCQGCSPNAHEGMMGDSPVTAPFGSMARSHHSGSRKSHHGLSPPAHRGSNQPRLSHRNRNRNRNRCPEDDLLCKQLRRGNRRYNRFRSRYGVSRLSLMGEDEILGLFEHRQRGRWGPLA